jgi:hypothetical protein
MRLNGGEDLTGMRSPGQRPFDHEFAFAHHFGTGARRARLRRVPHVQGK